MERWRGYEDMPPIRAGQMGAAALGAQPPASLFDATLYPHRSLSARGFYIVMAAAAALSLAFGGFFWLKGAWPVTGFFGLDLAALYWAFRLSYRQGRLHERIRVSPEALTVRRVSPQGYARDWSLQPYWVRVQMDEPAEHGSQLRLVSHGRSLVVGSFLPLEERVEVATRLRAALAGLREGRR